MSLLSFYIVFSYLFMIGVNISIPEDEKFGDNGVKYILAIIFAPILLPIYFGYNYLKHFKEN